jgi:hypothetical protein
MCPYTLTDYETCPSLNNSIYQLPDLLSTTHPRNEYCKHCVPVTRRKHFHCWSRDHHLQYHYFQGFPSLI